VLLEARKARIPWCWPWRDNALAELAAPGRWREPALLVGLQAAMLGLAQGQARGGGPRRHVHPIR
jgi:hypothetical protein